MMTDSVGILAENLKNIFAFPKHEEQALYAL
jgi:hypothetical protein